MKCLAPLLCLLLAACGAPSKDLHYDNSDLVLLTSYRAKELCSCVFVMGQSEEYCTAWTIASPNLATFQIDRVRKRVDTEALVMFSAGAHYESEHTGCILE